MPNDKSAGAQVSWQPQPEPGKERGGQRGGRRSRENQALIGADGLPTVARETRGGDFFYRFHFDLHYMPVIWARWLAGVAAMAMLVAILSGTDGALVWQSPASGSASVTAGAMIGLHAGRFADCGMRWLYFLCGIGGTLMAASGLVLWIVKRREKLPDPARPYFGFRLVE